MTEQRGRIRINEKDGQGAGPMPAVFEGDLISETTDADGITWLRLENCSPGAPERLTRRDLCKSVEPVGESPPSEGRSG